MDDVVSIQVGSHFMEGVEEEVQGPRRPALREAAPCPLWRASAAVRDVGIEDLLDPGDEQRVKHEHAAEEQQPAEEDPGKKGSKWGAP